MKFDNWFFGKIDKSYSIMLSRRFIVWASEDYFWGLFRERTEEEWAKLFEPFIQQWDLIEAYDPKVTEPGGFPVTTKDLDGYDTFIKNKHPGPEEDHILLEALKSKDHDTPQVEFGEDSYFGTAPRRFYIRKVDDEEDAQMEKRGWVERMDK